MKYPRYRRFYEQTLLGCRLGFGDSRRAVLVSAWAALRHPFNWFLPVTTVLCLTIFHASMIAWNPIPSDGNENLAWRVIAGDYFLFLVGWVAAWNAAARWRRHETLLEELVTTNLRPQVVGSILFAGSLNVWIVALAGLAVLESLLAFFSMSYPMIRSQEFEVGGILLLYIPLMIILALAYGILIAWFHLESLRIAFWLFSVAALSKINLRNKAFENLVTITGIVILLTLIGVSLTAFCALFATILFEVAQYATSSSSLKENAFLVMGWIFASLCGMSLVIFLKRRSCSQFENDFCKYFLMYTWWGAGETIHPKTYPRYYMQGTIYWLKWLRDKEDEEKGKQLYYLEHPRAEPIPGANFPESTKPECTND